MRLLNARKYGTRVEGAVYIGRGSKWGNPFVIGKDGDRREVIQNYEAWIVAQPRLMASLHELIGKDLVCWCDPLPCHGSILIKLVRLKFGVEQCHTE